MRFLSSTIEPQSIVTLSPDAAHHARVLRLAVGDTVELFDGQGTAIDATITLLSREQLQCRTGHQVQHHPRPSPPVHLIQACPKKAKLDTIVRMGTELGMQSLHVVNSRYASVQINHSTSLHTRLTRIASEALRQSKRYWLPQITLGGTLNEAAQSYRDKHADLIGVVAWEQSKRPWASCVDTLQNKQPRCIVVGAEGGLHTDEIAHLHAQGWQDVSLGNAILRVETAAPIMLALTTQCVENQP